MDKDIEHGIKEIVGTVGQVVTILVAVGVFFGAIPFPHGPHWVAHGTKHVLKEIKDWKAE